MTAIAWALALSTLAAVVEVAWFHIEPLGLFSNRDFFAEAAAPVFVWGIIYHAARFSVPRFDDCWRTSGRCTLVLGLSLPLIFCGSRLSVLAAMAGIAIARPRWWWQTLIALPIAAELGTKAMEYHGKLASLKERGQIWHQTAFHLTPWGHGMGSFALAYPHWEWAHSDALQAVSELGIGVLPFALVVAWLVWHAGTLRGPLVAALVTACGGFTLHEAGSGLVAAVLAGGVVGARHRQRSALPFGRDTVRGHSGADQRHSRRAAVRN